MNLKTCLLLMAVSTLMIGCKKSETKSPYGYPVIFHVNKGGAKPQPGQYCYFNVDMVINDSILSSNREAGELAKFPIPPSDKPMPNPQPPVLEGLKMMGVGDSITIFLPIDSLPEKKIPGFESAKNIAYRLTMVAIKSEAEYKKEEEAIRADMEAKAAVVKALEPEIAKKTSGYAKDYSSKKLDANIKTLPSGLKYMIVEDGEGSHPKFGETVSVQYYGVLKNGKMFDNSYKNGFPYKFPVGKGRVIPGWDEGILSLKKGSKAVLFIPSDLAYGKAGSPPAIPPDSELIFYIELGK